MSDQAASSIQQHTYLELISDGAKDDPATIKNVRVVRRNYMVNRWGMVGYLVRVPTEETKQAVRDLDEAGYDSWIVQLSIQRIMAEESFNE